MQRENGSEITFLVEDIEAILEMNRLLEKENQELKQELTRLKAQVSILKAHDMERKSMLWKKIQYPLEGNDKEIEKPVLEKSELSPARETMCKKSDPVAPSVTKENTGVMKVLQKSRSLNHPIRKFEPSPTRETVYKKSDPVASSITEEKAEVPDSQPNPRSMTPDTIQTPCKRLDSVVSSITKENTGLIEPQQKSRSLNEPDTKPELFLARETPCKKSDPVASSITKSLTQNTTPPKRVHEHRVSSGVIPPPPPPLPSRSLVGSAGVRRVPEVIEFYRYLSKKNAEMESKTNTTGVGSEASSRNMIGEIENRSTYLSAVKSDVAKQKELISFLTKEVENAAFTDISEVETFVKWLDRELSGLVDERAVLKHFPQWPERKVDALREAGGCFRDLNHLKEEVTAYKDNPKLPLPQTLRRIHSLQDRLERNTNNIERTRDGTCKKYKELHIPWEWMLEKGFIGQMRLSSLKLAKEYLKRISLELQNPRCSKLEDLLLQAVRFAYRVHQFAGGFDIQTLKAFQELRDLHSKSLHKHVKIHTS